MMCKSKSELRIENCFKWSTWVSDFLIPITTSLSYHCSNLKYMRNKNIQKSISNISHVSIMSHMHEWKIHVSDSKSNQFVNFIIWNLLPAEKSMDLNLLSQIKCWKLKSITNTFSIFISSYFSSITSSATLNHFILIALAEDFSKTTGKKEKGKNSKKTSNIWRRSNFRRWVNNTQDFPFIVYA